MPSPLRWPTPDFRSAARPILLLYNDGAIFACGYEFAGAHRLFGDLCHGARATFHGARRDSTRQLATGVYLRDALLEARRLARDCVDIAALADVFCASKMFAHAQSISCRVDPAENNV